MNSLKLVDDLELKMLKYPQVECSVTHHFGPGIYIREVKIPKGSLVLGHYQNFEHMNVFLQGSVTLFNDDGSQAELKAPMIFTGKPGRKKGFIHEDIVWLNIYPTNETDIEKLEAHYLTKTEAWSESTEATTSHSKLESSADREDFVLAINEMGFTQEQVREQSEIKEDMIDLPFGSYKIKVGKSTIEGLGLFATGTFESGDLVALARIKGKRTIAGRYTNHSINPNAKMKTLPSGDVVMMATKKIIGCHGGLDGEEITINYREALALSLETRRA